MSSYPDWGLTSSSDLVLGLGQTENRTGRGEVGGRSETSPVPNRGQEAEVRCRTSASAHGLSLSPITYTVDRGRILTGTFDLGLPRFYGTLTKSVGLPLVDYLDVIRTSPETSPDK